MNFDVTKREWNITVQVFFVYGSFHTWVVDVVQKGSKAQPYAIPDISAAHSLGPVD